MSHLSEDGEEKPIAFASCTLSQIEQNYSMIAKEVLAIIFDVKKFHQYLFGQQFTLLTDHKTLTYILGPKRGIPFNWQLVHTILSIVHPSTKEMLMCLPRKTTEEAADRSMEGNQVNRVQMKHTPITASRIREATRGNPVLSCVLPGWTSEENTPEKLQY